jgi:dihydropteroate synthase
VGKLQPLKLGRLTLDWARTYILGVVNCTPDSFSDGNLQAKDMGAADIVDVGGESTRPGAAPVTADEEWRRIAEPLQHYRQTHTVSVDTYKAEVAARALAAGAEIVNDVSGGRLDPDLLTVCARADAVLIVGHMRGTAAEMSGLAAYDDVVREVREELTERLTRAREAGVKKLLVDPGLGFAKTAEHNLALLLHLDALTVLGCPIVVGASRKSFLGKLTGREVGERELATAAANTAAILHGASVVRVHDPAAQRDAVLVADAILRAGG